MAIPLFFLAESVFDRRVRQVIREMALHLVPARQLPDLGAAPAVPLVLFLIPLEELIIRGARTILHV